MPDRAVQITVLGGSAVGTPELIDALRRQGQPTRPIHLVLHGRTHDKLDPVAHVTSVMAHGLDWLTVSASTELAEALGGAEIVINQVRVGGLAARAFDETFPIPLGIPGEETVGPGGFANALRTVPAVLKLVKAIEQYAPAALLLSFTNPASVVQQAVTRTSRLRVIGLCDGPVTMIGWAASALGLAPDQIQVDYLGMHHYGFITRVWHDSEDVTARMLAGLDRVAGIDIDLDLIRSLGALPTMFFRYFFHADRMLEKQRRQIQSRAEQLQVIEAELLAEYAHAEGRPAGLSKRSAKWYDAIIAPVLMTLIDRRTGTHIVNVVNGDTQPWLPPDAIIETPCLFDRGTVRPLAMPVPNREIEARIQHNCAYEQLMVEAILEQSQVKALRALCMNELVPTASQARAILDRIWPDADPARASR
ncbi:MAG TPA: hypothetical protein VMT34_06370 [Aggregatilineales bacterium]|nr:hypothetical protein [Aggregatilineales bacterium]